MKFDPSGSNQELAVPESSCGSRAIAASAKACIDYPRTTSSRVVASELGPRCVGLLGITKALAKVRATPANLSRNLRTYRSGG